MTTKAKKREARFLRVSGGRGATSAARLEAYLWRWSSTPPGTPFLDVVRDAGVRIGRR